MLSEKSQSQRTHIDWLGLRDKEKLWGRAVCEKAKTDTVPFWGDEKKLN